MPANAAAARVTDQYRAQLLTLRQRAVTVAQRNWDRVDLQHLDSSYADWLAATAPVVDAAQRAGSALSTTYLASYSSTSLEQQVPPEPVDHAAIVAEALAGRTAAQALVPPLYTLKSAIARLPGPRALDLALTRALRTVSSGVIDAATGSLHAAMLRSPLVIAWTRVVSPNPCGACLALAGREFETRKAVERHPGCRCTAEPVIDGVLEKVKRAKGADLIAAMTPDQLAALFHGRGGAAKAQFLLKGEINLDDLVRRSPKATGGAYISETPLADLAA